MNHILENELVRVTFDGNGNLLSLVNRKTGREYVQPHGLWRLIINEGESLEVEIRSDRAAGRVEIAGDSFRIEYRDLITHTGHKVDIGVRVTGKLAGEELQMDIELENRMAGDNLIRECHFPVIALADGSDEMIYHNGVNSKRLEEYDFTPQYKAMEYIYNRDIKTYPTHVAPVNCFALAHENEGMYFGSHDSTFQITEHIIEVEESNHYNLLMAKTPFLKSGERGVISGYVVSLYNGKWHAAADKYRAWAESWFEFKPIPEEITHMQGWQRIIMRSQYGENFFRFDQLPQIFRDGAAAGIDTAFLFGWHHGGHDSDYPNYVPSEDLGGQSEFKKNIAEFRKLGGKVILYANGQLIDRNSEYYLSGKGPEFSTKDHRGNEQMQYYRFSGRGIFNAVHGNRTLVTACPTCHEWTDEMKKVIDLAHELGCDGVFFDQLGGGMMACGDPSHGHPVPFFGIMNARRDMVAELRNYAKSLNLTFGIELVTDITAQHADYVHSLFGGAEVSNGNWEKRGEKPKVINESRWFRYIFPEVILTNRQIRNDTDIEQRVNRMLMQNLKSDVEIYRCQKTIAETPHYREYLAQVNAFRKKHGDRLFNALFRADSLHETDNMEIDSEGHLCTDGSVAVIATQSHLASTEATITVPGYKLAVHDTLGDAELLPNGSVRLGKHGLILLVFEK